MEETVFERLGVDHYLVISRGPKSPQLPPHSYASGSICGFRLHGYG
jgi:hypothetical protein